MEIKLTNQMKCAIGEQLVSAYFFVPIKAQILRVSCKKINKFTDNSVSIIGNFY